MHSLSTIHYLIIHLSSTHLSFFTHPFSHCPPPVICHACIYPSKHPFMPLPMHPSFTIHPSIIHSFIIHYPLANHPSVIHPFIHHQSSVIHPSIHPNIHSSIIHAFLLPFFLSLSFPPSLIHQFLKLLKEVPRQTFCAYSPRHLEKINLFPYPTPEVF